MAFAIIPLSMKAYVTATAPSGDYTLYALKFVSNNEDEDNIEGVEAIYTAEDLQIPLLSTQQWYGVYFNPIDDGTNYIFKAAYLGDKYTATVDKTDSDTLSGSKAMVFTNDNAEGRLLPVVTEDDNGKTIEVINGEWTAVGYKLLPDATLNDFNKMLQVKAGGTWSISSAPINVSRSSNYDKNIAYLIKNDENGLTLADAAWRVAAPDIPTVIFDTISTAITPQLTSLIQSKKWTVLTTSVSNEEAWHFVETITGPKFIFVGQTSSISVSYQGSNYITFGGYEYATGIGGFIHTLVYCGKGTTSPEVNVTIFVRYEE